MMYVGIGLWVYMTIGLFLGIHLVTDPDYNEAVDETAKDQRDPRVHLFYNKLFVVIFHVILGLPVWLYTTLKPSDEEDDE